jgi:hypothetical protein
MSRIVIAATETQTQNARHRAAGEIGITAVVAGTARAVLAVFGDLDGDSGISPRLAPIPGAATRRLRHPRSDFARTRSRGLRGMLPRKGDMMGR